MRQTHFKSRISGKENGKCKNVVNEIIIQVTLGWKPFICNHSVENTPILSWPHNGSVLLLTESRLLQPPPSIPRVRSVIKVGW